LTWTLELTPRFRKQFDALPVQAQRAIDRKIEQIERDPFQTDIQKMKGILNTYRVRTGDYRIILELDLTARHTRVMQVRHRQSAYD
jgi:mRNA interferase RelE/StbE